MARNGTENDTVMTKTGYERLTSELIELRSNGRSEISRQLEEARSFGDVSENAEYAAAKDEQAKLESRILWLESQLSKAKILDTSNIDASKVAVGTTVTIEDITNRELFVYTMVGSEEADPKNKKVSIHSPVGQSVNGGTTTDSVTVKREWENGNATGRATGEGHRQASAYRQEYGLNSRAPFPVWHQPALSSFQALLNRTG